MSLQIWLPLIKDTNNQGISTMTGSLTNSSVSYQDGKIGKALRIANYATSTATFPGIVDKTIWSISLWLKLLSSDPTPSYQDFFTLGLDNGGYTSGGFRIEHTATAGAIQFVTPKNTTYGSNTNGWWTFYSNSTIAKDTWAHIVVVNNGTNYLTYINNSLVNTTAISSFTSTTSKLTGTLTLGMSGAYCLMNDFRIYDNILSIKEIKELSKGIALHWPLNNKGLGFFNPNLVPNYGNYNTEENALVWTSASTDGWHFLPGSSFVVEPSTTYIYSVYSDGTLYNSHNSAGHNVVNKDFTMWLYLCNDGTTKDYANGGYDQAINFNSSNYNHVQIGNRHIWKYTTTSTQKYMSVRVNNYSDGTNNLSVKYWGIKVEKSNSVTPWCPNSSDTLYSTLKYADNIEYDISGYMRNGSIVSAFPTIDSDSPRYNVSYKYTGSVNNAHYNTTTDLNFTDNFSWSIWVKTNYTGTTAQYIFTVGRADAGGYGYGLQCASTSACNVRYGNASWSVAVTGGAWTHLAFTKSGTTCKIYKNGVLTSTQTFSGTTPTFSDGAGVGIGCFHYTGNIYPYYGNISDFRIYATCLTDTDIAELYNKPISIDNNGKIFALEYNEV